MKTSEHCSSRRGSYCSAAIEGAGVRFNLYNIEQHAIKRSLASKNLQSAQGAWGLVMAPSKYFDQKGTHLKAAPSSFRSLKSGHRLESSLQRQMIYWVNFARSGDPNSRGLPRWPAFTNVESKVRYLGDPITVGGVANIHGLSAFDAVYTAVRGKPFSAR